MNILYLCTYYHRAMIFRDSMNELMSLGHKVKAFNAVVKNARIDEKYKEIMDDLVIHKECFNKKDRFFYYGKQRKILKQLIKSYSLNKFDILHSHMLFNGGYVAYLLKKKYGLPYVVSIRNTDMNVFLKIPMFKSIANRIVENASGVQFLSLSYKKKFLNNYVKSDLKEEVKRKSVVINNGLEEFWVKNKGTVKTLTRKNEISILCVGKIDKNKNITTTVKAIRLLINKGFKVKLTVVGQVVDRTVLENIKDISFVNIINYITKEELINVYRKNDIYVMPSITESFGRVYAEAMTQGLPVIYTKGQGFDGIFEDGEVGYAVPSLDPKYISKCIEDIVSNYQKISVNCISNCEVFEWKYIGERLNEFYHDSLKRGRMTK